MTKSFDVIVPEYNELSRGSSQDFTDQLRYFDGLSRILRKDGHGKVILVDDASKDESWKSIQGYPDPAFAAFRMPVNGQKVGAMKKGVEESGADYIILTDFDSTIRNPERIPYAIERLEASGAVGASLRVIPRQNNLWGAMQDFDYAIGRAIGWKYLQGQKAYETKVENGIPKVAKVGGPKRIRCVPGAGGIWKRDVVLDCLNEHSGRHNGDDMETTAIAMRKGYNITYDDSLIVDTEVPESFYGFRQKLGLQKKGLTLFQQRTRWQQGALETFDKEREFYMKNASEVLENRFGVITLWEWSNWVSVPLGLSLAGAAFVSGEYNNLLSFYLGDMAFVGALGLYSRNELKSKKELLLTPLMPAARVAISFPTILNAGRKFVSGKLKEFE